MTAIDTSGLSGNLFDSIIMVFGDPIFAGIFFAGFLFLLLTKAGATIEASGLSAIFLILAFASYGYLPLGVRDGMIIVLGIVIYYIYRRLV